MSIPEHVLTTRTKLAETELQCAETADLLKASAESLTGSQAIGFEAMEHAFRQMSKVVRNYMRAVDREIEDRSPGTVDDIYAALERMDQAKDKLKERPAEPEPKAAPEPAPEGVTEALLEAGLYQSDPPEKVNEVLLRKLNEAKQCHYIALEHGGTFNGGSSVYWERKAERYQTGVNWNRARMAETL